MQEDVEAGKLEIPTPTVIGEDAIQVAVGESIPAAPA
jgi:hypothetical protein